MYSLFADSQVCFNHTVAKYIKPDMLWVLYWQPYDLTNACDVSLDVKQRYLPENKCRNLQETKHTKHSGAQNA